MLEFFLPVILKSKPTGNQGKGRNIYQNTAQYLKFKKDCLAVFNDYQPYDCLQSCEGILIVGVLGKLKCRSQDIGQINGAIFDILVTAKILADDRMTNFSKSLQYYFRSIEKQGAYIAIAESKQDWEKCLISEEKARSVIELF